MIGEGIDRVHGRAKARGAVAYTGDLVLEGMVHAALVPSPVSNGRIAALDAAGATSVAGVLAVLDHGNAPKLAPRGPGEMPLLLQDDRINYGGQPIAAVIAETLAAARRAARLVEARCESRPSVSALRRDAPDLFAPAAVLGEPPDSVRGDLARTWAEADVRLETTYTAPMQHHNPIEPHVALASWEDGRLTLYASLQGVQACRDVLARSFGLPPDSVRVVARFLGGGFGSKAELVAVRDDRGDGGEARGRPVRLELSRNEMFRMVGCRAASIDRADGRLTALEHHAVAQSSAVDEFCDPHGRISQMLYACPMSQVAAEMLGLPVDQVRFEMGDSDLPESPRAAGSMTTASVPPVVAAAARALRGQIIAAACADDRSPLGGLDPGSVEIRDGTIMSRRDPARAERCADAAARRPAGSIEPWVRPMPSPRPPPSPCTPSARASPRWRSRPIWARSACAASSPATARDES